MASIELQFSTHYCTFLSDLLCELQLKQKKLYFVFWKCRRGHLSQQSKCRSGKGHSPSRLITSFSDGIGFVNSLTEFLRLNLTTINLQDGHLGINMTLFKKPFRFLA